MAVKRIFITVEGIVQGVGFRPFVYNLATKLSLNGWVNNNSQGVYIDLEGEEHFIKTFLEKLKNDPPPLARIENIFYTEKEILNYTCFSIKKSEITSDKITLISPDIATCRDCLSDIHDPLNRRYRYPFTNCTNCGPRFSIIKSIPYDRDKTTMKKFQMCKPCEIEYTDPSNRRFHAQPNACSHCGPHIWITDSKGNKIATTDPIAYAEEKLKEGHIFAIKGLCGFHLACDAKNKNAIDKLRTRKNRPFKPFAVMAKDINIIKKYCYVNAIEEKLLTGIRKPIVLLNRKESYSLPESLAPNQNTLGVMLPYTPLHNLIFGDNTELLVMTSANIYGLPLEYKNEFALSNLSKIADYFLLHDRDIYIPVDDSVVRVVNNKESMIRRARGYTPDPVLYKDISPILACGPNMKNTFALGKENFIFLSQHNGDLENLETYEHYKRNIQHFKDIFSFSPEALVCDMHPLYSSTKYAEECSLPIIKVQHHHAHIVSCMVENKVKDQVIGIAYDGTGYGTDGKIWGSEFLICDEKNFKRVAHLRYLPLPGGESAIHAPWKIGAGYAYVALKDEGTEVIKNLYGNSSSVIVEMIKRNINCIDTCSMGRLFDSVSSIICVCNKATYEGQGSIELEALISRNVKFDKSAVYDYNINLKNDVLEIDPIPTIKQIIEDKFNYFSKEKMSIKFHNTIICFTLEVCEIIRKKTKINKIALSGGVFQNYYLLKNLCNELEKTGFEVYTHSQFPSNDGGVALGQIVIGDNLFKERKIKK